MSRVQAAALLLVALGCGALFYWQFAHSAPASGSAPVAHGQLAENPAQSQPENHTGNVRTVAASDRAPGEPDNSKPSSPSETLEKLLGRSLGLMSADDMARARLTLDSLLDASRSELESFRTAHQARYDARATAREAELHRTLALWRAVAEAAVRGNYWLGPDYPSRFPQSAREVHYQALSVTNDGKPATAVFFIDKTTGSGVGYLGIADDYRNQHRLWLEEAAYRFNGLSDQERADLHRRYQQVVASQGYDRLPEDLAGWFPFENTVDATTLRMRVPR